jgi:hypothetical protein
MRQDKCLKALPTLIDERFVLLDRMDEDELLRRREEILSSLK